LDGFHLSLSLQQNLATDDARDQRRFLGAVGACPERSRRNGVMGFLQAVVPHDAQELLDQSLAGDLAAG